MTTVMMRMRVMHMAIVVAALRIVVVLSIMIVGMVVHRVHFTHPEAFAQPQRA